MIENLVLSGHFWYRDSTDEWVFEVEFHIPDVICSTQRYPGKTKEEALQCFRELFPETLKEDLELIQQNQS